MMRSLVTAALLALAGPARHAPRATALAVAVAVAAAGVVIGGARFSTDVTRLVPRNAEKTALYFSLMEEFGSLERLYVVFSSDDWERHLDAVDSIGEALTVSPLIRSARWKLTGEQKRFVQETLLPRIPLYLSAEERDEFLQRLTPEGIRGALERTRSRLLLPGGGVALRDPLGLSDIYAARLRLGEISFDPSTGYFITPDRERLILTVEPTGPSRDISYAARLMKEVEGILAEFDVDGLDARVTGAHAIALHEASIMKGEMVRNFIMAVAGVVGLCLILFRGIRGLLAAVVPVLVSLVLTTAIGSLILGSVTEVTGGFSGLLMGLGVDLGIVLYVRVTVLGFRRRSREEALDSGIRRAGPGITTGVLTTAATFLPMLLSSFGGIRELGLLTGVGILITWLMLFLLFPLLARTDRHADIRLPVITSLFLAANARPRLTLITILLASITLGLLVPRLRIEEDVMKLGARDNPAREVLMSLSDRYLTGQNVFVSGRADSASEAAEKSRLIALHMERPFSVADLLPSPSEQERTVRTLAEVDAARVVRTVRRLATEEGFAPGVFDDYLGWLRRTIENRDSLDFEDLAPLGYVLERVIRPDDDGYRFVVFGTARDTASLAREANARGLAFTGSPFVRAELFRLLKTDALRVTAVGLLAVNAILLLDFRRLLPVVMCQVPPLVAVLWTLGLMALLGVSLNFMNAIVFVMLFGIGTDYTIHLLHRRTVGGGVEDIARDTAAAVALAGMTTLVGFGSMGFSSYRGLASLGAATALGVASAVIVSLTLIPAFFAWEDRRRD